MEPVTTAIIAALAAGAAGGITDVAKKAISDGYSGLKALISKKFGSNSEVSDALDKLQATPDSPKRQQTLAEELEATNASADPELLGAAQALLELIKGLPQGERHVQHAEGIGIALADRGGIASVNFVAPSTKRDSD